MSLSVVCCLVAAACSGAPSHVRRAGTTAATTPTGELAGLDRTQPVPPDTDVEQGALENGLRYVVRSNQAPGGHVELRLVVDTGSVLQDADQSGVAHFLEHMVFNGTDKYAGNELVKVLESFGAEFGADINASTSYDETVYSLSVPTQDPTMFTTALGILEQWLAHATLAEADVTAERGVVLDEWRQSAQDVSGREYAAIRRLFLAGTPYDGKDPIGTDTAIQAMTPALLRRFYDEWYRPDNAAIVIVGDIDPAQVVEQITSTFSADTDRGHHTARPTIALDPFATRGAAVHLDADEASSTVALTFPLPAGDRSTPAAVEQGLLLQLGYSMIVNRLSDDIAQGDVPFTSASLGSNDLVRAIDAPSVLLQAKGADTTAALDALLVEFERVRQFGFAGDELTRAVDEVRSSVDAAYEGRDTTQDVDYAATYVQSVLAGTPMADARTAHDLAGAVLDEATTDLVGSVLTDRWAASSPHVLVLGPDDATAPTETAALELLGEVAGRKLAPRPAMAPVATELMAAPEPVKESSSQRLTGDPGAYLEPTVLTFPNGVRVVLNRTEIAKGTVALGAASPGGTSLVAEADLANASIAPYVVTSGGVGDLDQAQLERVLAGATVSLAPGLTSTQETFDGSSSTDDLETMLQLLHQYLAAPRFDANALGTVVDQVRPYAEDPNSDPDLAQQVALTEARYGASIAHFRPVPTADELASVTLDGIERVWTQRFGNAGDWVFVLSGDFDLDTATELARAYLGTLPGTGQTEQWVDVQPDPPAGVVTREVHAGTGARATLTSLFTTEAGDDITTQLTASLLTSVVNSRLTDHLREELGDSYSPSADVSVLSEPDRIVESTISVTGAPEKMAELSTALHADLAQLVADGPTAAELAAARQELSDQLQLFSNEGLISVMLDEELAGGAIDDLLASPSALASIDAAAVQALAAVAFPADRYIEIVGLPA